MKTTFLMILALAATGVHGQTLGQWLDQQAANFDHDVSVAIAQLCQHPDLSKICSTAAWLHVPAPTPKITVTPAPEIPAGANVWVQVLPMVCPLKPQQPMVFHMYNPQSKLFQNVEVKPPGSGGLPNNQLPLTAYQADKECAKETFGTCTAYGRSVMTATITTDGKMAKAPTGSAVSPADNKNSTQMAKVVAMMWQICKDPPVLAQYEDAIIAQSAKVFPAVAALPSADQTVDPSLAVQ